MSLRALSNSSPFYTNLNVRRHMLLVCVSPNQPPTGPPVTGTVTKFTLFLDSDTVSLPNTQTLEKTPFFSVRND